MDKTHQTNRGGGREMVFLEERVLHRFLGQDKIKGKKHAHFTKDDT